MGDGARETRAAVVVSEEQGEVEKFRRWDLDVVPHRRLVAGDLRPAEEAGPGWRLHQDRREGVAADVEGRKLRVDQWREKEATRSAVQVAIHYFLYSDETGLPAGACSDEDVTARSEAVFTHVFRLPDRAVAVLPTTTTRPD